MWPQVWSTVAIEALENFFLFLHHSSLPKLSWNGCFLVFSWLLKVKMHLICFIPAYLINSGSLTLTAFKYLPSKSVSPMNIVSYLFQRLLMTSGKALFTPAPFQDSIAGYPGRVMLSSWLFHSSANVQHVFIFHRLESFIKDKNTIIIHNIQSCD